VNQTVQWVDDLLNLSGSNSQAAAPVDPTTAILNAAYGQSSSSNTTDPTMSILDSAYGDGATGSSTSSSTSAGDSAPAASSGNAPSQFAPSPLAGGNAGSAASVNVYA
jgi:hypothetical protein